MMITTEIRRPLGTMIVYGFPKASIEVELGIVRRLGAEVLEILPDWRAYPDPVPLRTMVGDLGLKIHSAHGCWGGQSIRAKRVDLGNSDPGTWTESVDDLRRCVDWLHAAGGSCLVVHPGGLSDPQDLARRRGAITRGLLTLAEDSAGLGVTICVENMPPGVIPGSHMIDLREIVDEIDRPDVALALDTGHARISASVSRETLAAGSRLKTTHVHDNDGRQDSHLPPGSGTIDWGEWVQALDAIDYRGPIMLECIKYLRDKPESLTPEFLGRLRWMCGLERSYPTHR
jgi:sugar phosphate isomerase/epimerase